MSLARGGTLKLLFFLAGLLGKWVLPVYYSTIHIANGSRSQSRFNRYPQPTGIYAFWHSHQLSIAWHCRRTRAAILVSRSADGEYIARIAASLGYRPVRGSSSRGGTAGLKKLLEFVRQARAVAVTPDGPRGPRHSIKPGLLMLAMRSGYPITPVALGHSRFWELPSWDGFRIPKPFSRGYYCWGEPMHVPSDADAAALEELAQELRERMVALERHADRAARSLAGPQGRVDSPPAV